MPASKLVAAVCIAAATFCFLPAWRCKKENKRICAYRILYKWDIYDAATEKMIVFSDSVDFYRKNDLFVCALPVYESSTESSLDNIKNIITDSIIKEWVSYKYYLFSVENSSAFCLDSLNQKGGAPINKDSFLNSKLFKSLIVISEYDTLLSEKKTKKNREIIQVYANRFKPDLTYSDTSILVFSEVNNCLQFSLGNDSTNFIRLPLINLTSKYNSYFDTVLKKQIPERRLIFQMKSIDTEVPEPITKLLQFKFY